MHIYIHIVTYVPLTALSAHGICSTTEGRFGLYTILLLPILYGVGHTKARSEGARILPNSRAIVMQLSGQCR